jgi:hypothetical protein
MSICPCEAGGYLTHDSCPAVPVAFANQVLRRGLRFFRRRSWRLSGAGQRSRLADRVAHDLEVSRRHLPFVGKAELLLGQAAVLADHRVHGEAVGSEDATLDGRLALRAGRDD